MSNVPETAWVEAAQTAAAEVYEAFGDMTEIGLKLQNVPADDANGTNSADRGFLDFLKSGGHLNDTFLRDV